MADKGIDPVPVLKKVSVLQRNIKNIDILWASTREVYNYIQAKQIRCNIITMPPKIIDSVLNFNNSTKLLTSNTVNGFLSDSKKSKFKI